MFGRLVTFDGTEVFVSCVPSTPYSEVLLRAATILRREEAGFTPFTETDARHWMAERARAEAMV